MKRLLVLGSAALLPLAVASSADAERERPLFGLRAFIGLWEGIDPADGGNARRSITCFEDRSCRLVANDSVMTLCERESGFALGTGGLEGDELVFPVIVLTCPDGTSAELATSYRPDRRNRTLVETPVVVGGDTLPNIILHKISR